MQAIKDIFASERGLVFMLLFAAVTTFAFMGRITMEQWDAQVKWVVAFYMSAKTLSSVAGSVAGAIAKPKAPEVAPPEGSAEGGV